MCFLGLWEGDLKGKMLKGPGFILSLLHISVFQDRPDKGGVAISTFLRHHRGRFRPNCGRMAAIWPKLKLCSTSTSATATAAAESGKQLILKF